MNRRIGNPHGRKATVQGFLPNGRMVLRVPVRVVFNNSKALTSDEVVLEHVLAFTPAEAANYVRDLFATVPETEVYAYGQRGGVTYRYVGWYSAINNAMSAAWQQAKQLTLEVGSDA